MAKKICCSCEAIGTLWLKKGRVSATVAIMKALECESVQGRDTTASCTGAPAAFTVTL